MWRGDLLKIQVETTWGLQSLPSASPSPMRCHLCFSHSAMPQLSMCRLPSLLPLPSLPQFLFQSRAGKREQEGGHRQASVTHLLPACTAASVALTRGQPLRPPARQQLTHHSRPVPQPPSRQAEHCPALNLGSTKDCWAMAKSTAWLGLHIPKTTQRLPSNKQTMNIIFHYIYKCNKYIKIINFKLRAQS